MGFSVLVFSFCIYYFDNKNRKIAFDYLFSFYFFFSKFWNQRHGVSTFVFVFISFPSHTPHWPLIPVSLHLLVTPIPREETSEAPEFGSLVDLWVWPHASLTRRSGSQWYSQIGLGVLGVLPTPRKGSYQHHYILFSLWRIQLIITGWGINV